MCLTTMDKGINAMINARIRYRPLVVAKFVKSNITNHTDPIMIGNPSPFFEAGIMDMIDAFAIIDKEITTDGCTWIQTDETIARGI